ncbi:DMT family transporter [Nocardiopsis gilva]|uniref:DMT family transporter n=1 Tax=Nocardiopsis gilva TaxID=280236 RepID=UPI000349693A|nr:DMT family transporter [Nocardiopsis gilva]
MIYVSVAIALAGAFCLALGSALQERDAVRAPGHGVARMDFLFHLAQRPRWLVGTVAAGAGATLHLIALSGAPLTIIQPIGVTGLVFAIVLSALFNRLRVRRSQILAGGAVMVGLVGVLALFPHGQDAPIMTDTTAMILAGSVMAVGVVIYLCAHWVPPGMRALLLAGAGGTALGTTSGIARVVAAQTVVDVTAIFSLLTVLAVALALFGGMLMQNAYRTGHFAAAYAMLLIADPITGVGIGSVMLGEGLPGTPLAQVLAAISAVVAIVGTAVLARAKTRNPEAVRRFGAGRPDTLLSPSVQEKPHDTVERPSLSSREPSGPGR